MRLREIGTLWVWPLGLGIALVTCGGAGGNAAEIRRVTTAGAIAVANLNHQIAQRRDEAGVVDLLLSKSRFLADYDALDRAVALTESRFETGADLLRRAKARSAVHRFAEALADISAAERAGVGRDEIIPLRASILAATGRADEVIPQLEADVAGRPSFASLTTLAGAYASTGRFADADRLYVAALADLDTTSPFPHAWVYFARGTMWAESGGDPVRGETLLAQALVHLPEFVQADIHIAELEASRGDLASATKRLERVVASSVEPEALALLGELHTRTGDLVRGRHEISRARRRFEVLLARHPLAFADHAAEFYMGAGADAARAWTLARQNLANRETGRALALAIKAGHMAGRHDEACALASRKQHLIAQTTCPVGRSTEASS